MQSAWMTEWYLGDPTRVYYPPLTVWVLGIVSAIFGDVIVGYRVFVTGILVTLGVSVYVVGARWGRNHWAAAIGGLLAVMAPYTLRTIFSEGNLARGLAILPLPWIVWYTEILLTEKHTRRVLAILAVLWAFVVVAHVMQAAMFAVIVAAYIGLRVLNNVYIPIRRSALAMVPIFGGFCIASFYLVPAYGRFELANVPALPESKIDLFSISLEAFLPRHESIEAISIGAVTLVAALITTIGLSKQHQKTLTLAGFLAVALAFGESSGIFGLIPLNTSLLPERFLNASAIFFPLIIATIPRYATRWNIAIAFFALAILLVEFLPAWRVVQMRSAPPDELGIARALGERSLDGRIAPLTLPNPTASQMYLTSAFGGRDNVSGWALENTPHQDAIRRLLSAAARAPDYLARVLSLYNADYFVTRRTEATSAISAPYDPVAVVDDLILWERRTPSSFAQVLPDGEGMLVIGQNATSWLFSFPFASEGYSPNPADYSADYLSHFSVIGLNRLDTSGDVEAALRSWVEAGNTLVVDLSGTDAILGQGFSLFGVQSFPTSLAGPSALRWPDTFTAMPDELTFAPEDTPWVGATYRQLDAVVATVEHRGSEFPLLGYRQVGDGVVWYVGFNFFFWLDINERDAALAELRDYILAGAPVRRTVGLPAFAINGLERDASQITFSYENLPEAVDVVLSMTYFPRWRVEIDGAPADLNNHEHLAMVRAPAGSHTITLTYAPYGLISILSAGAAVLSALGLILYAALTRTPIAVSDRLETFFDRHPPPLERQQAPPEKYVECPRCGFERAETGPPTNETYPFLSISCPNCEYEL